MEPTDELSDLFSTGGRQAVLEFLKAAGKGLRERQDVANAISRRAREAVAPPAPAPRKQPSLGPLTVAAEGGLCNKLRCILSYREVAHDNGRQLLVWWRGGDFCPGEFHQLFEPLEGVTITSDSGVLERSLACMGMTTSSIAGEFGSHSSILGTPREVSMWRHLRPKPEVAAAVAETVARSGPRFAAVHVRRTDFLQLFGVKTPDDAFESFLRKHAAAGCNAYVATDNAKTQSRFATALGDAFRARAPIDAYAHGLRHTSLLDSVVDIFTCVEAEAFKGTAGSSFSDAIWALRRVRGVAAQDEHGWDRDPKFDRAPRTTPSDAPHGRDDVVLDLPLPQPLLALMGAPVEDDPAAVVDRKL